MPDPVFASAQLFAVAGPVQCGPAKGAVVRMDEVLEGFSDDVPDGMPEDFRPVGGHVGEDAFGVQRVDDVVGVFHEGAEPLFAFPRPLVHAQVLLVLRREFPDAEGHLALQDAVPEEHEQQERARSDARALEPRRQAEAHFFGRPAPQGLVIGGSGVRLHAVEMAVDGGQHVQMAGAGRREENAGWIEDDGGILDPRILCPRDAGEAVGHHGIGLAAGHGGEGGVEIRLRHEGRLQAEAAGEFGQGFLLEGVVEHGHALAVQIQQGADAAAAPGVDLEPIGEHRFAVESVELPALGREGHVGHEVDFSRGHAVQPLGPGSRNVFERPMLLCRDGLDQVDENALGLAGIGERDFGGIPVDSHPHVRFLLGGGKNFRHGQQAKAGDHGDPEHVHAIIFLCGNRAFQ